MRAVAASARAATATDAKNQVRRLGPESSNGDQNGLMTCGSCAVVDTVTMRVIGRPRDRRTKGTAMVAKPPVDDRRRPEPVRDAAERTAARAGRGRARERRAGPSRAGPSGAPPPPFAA